MQDNALTGMAGQIASTVWLCGLGLRARMLPITSTPDPGFDVAIEDRSGCIKVEVKTSYFADGRGSELMRHGDRMPITRKAIDPDIYVWAVCSPKFFAGGPVIVDIVAVAPGGFISDAYRRKGKVPGVRLGDLPPNFTHFWLETALKSACDPRSPQTIGPILSTLHSLQEAMDEAQWIAKSLYGGRKLVLLDDRALSAALAVGEPLYESLCHG